MGYAKYSGFGGGSGGGVTTLNGESGAIVLVAGTGISITPAGQNITIANTESAFTPGNLTDVGTDGIVITGGTNAVNGAGTSIAQHVADATHNGYLSSTDWNTFNTAASSGANKTLSNLTSPTAFNQSLFPGSTNTFDIGQSGTVLRSLYVNTILDSSGVVAVQVLNHSLVNNAGSVVLNFSGTNLNANTHSIINVVDPTNPQDAATKNYVDTHGGTGTVTSVSVVSANGFTGSVATATTTPAITLTGTLTGDLTGTLDANILATVNGNVGSFGSSTSIPNFTVNAKGLITAAGGNVVVAPAGTLTGTTLNSTVVTSSLTSLGTQSAALNMGTHLINNVVNPVSAQDAATKNYVDNALAGINPAVAVQAATTAAGDTSGFTYNNGASGIGAFFTGSVNTPVVIDGYTFTALGQRLLVKNDTQSPSGAFNGVYYVTQVQTALLAPILTRALDYDQPSDINNTGAIPVINGTVNGTTQWVLTSLVNTVGTDPLTYTQFARNPADYLLKSNNLSDVSSANTSLNNLLPSQTSNNGKALFTDGTNASWQTPGISNAVAASIGLTNSVTPSGGAPIIYDTVIYDTASAYSTITGLYTCPATAFYRVSILTYHNTAGNGQIFINGSGFAYIYRSGTGSQAPGSLTVSCTAGDTISIRPDAGDTFLGNVPYVNYLSIEQIH